MVLSEKQVLNTIKQPTYLFTQEEMDSFINSIIIEFNTFGPIAKDKQTIFGKISAVNDIVWNYGPTILPPKKYLHQPLETLFSFEDGGDTVKETLAQEKQILFGLHPCDVNAIKILNRVFTGKYDDPYYVERRKKTFIIALSCDDALDTCFCTGFDSGPHLDEGYDLLITKLGERFLIEIGTQQGKNLIETHGNGETIDHSLLKEYLQLKSARIEKIRHRIKKNIETESLGQLLEVNVDNPIWNDLKEECLACGSCTIVCPTCFCFNIIDKVDLTLKSGERQRVWDSCMLLEFAEVALGVNFRDERAARIKQRIYHKLYSFQYQFDTIGCVGCGRCVNFCIKKIDPREIIENLRGEENVR